MVKIKTHKYVFGEHVEFVTQEEADNINRVFPLSRLEKMSDVPTPIEALGENENSQQKAAQSQIQTNKHK